MSTPKQKIGKSGSAPKCLTPVQQTKIKSDFAKLFLEEHFKSVFNNVNRKQTREEEFQKSLKEMGGDSQQKLEMQRTFRESETAKLRRRRQKLGVDNFDKIRVIGRGGFGEVWVVRDRRDKQVYAMKCMNKRDLVKRNQIMNTLAERDFMTQSKNPFSVQLIYSFQDQKNLYLVMEYCSGGDLMQLLINKDIFTEDETRFFVAESLLALHHVHLTGFIHRDLKPDNLLLTREGHIRLTDFGLSAKVERFSDPLYKLIDELNLQNKPSVGPSNRDKKRRQEICSTVGTPDYIAPEVLRKQPYNFKVDFWSLGSIMYEMLFGCPPFSSDSPRETALKIVKWKETLTFPPSDVSPAAIDLMKKLLCDADHRLDFDGIKNHPFFKGINFDNILNIRSPCPPSVMSDDDTSNFDQFDPKEEDDVPDDEGIADIVFQNFRYVKEE